MKYLAINIGPIGQTLSMARKPREFWAASYLFSYLMQNILKKINEKVKSLSLISPYYDKDNTKSKIGVGLYPDRAFYGHDYISSAVLPDTMVTIGEGAFLGCHELQSVDLGNGVQIIGENAFYASSGGYDNKISTITIPSSVTSIGRDAFDGIPSITFLGDAPEMDITDMICSWNVTIYYSGSGFETYIENWVDEYGDHSITWIKQ